MNLAIIWHMHQPLYRQPGSDVAILPWVRLHAVKDYLHMAQVLAAHPDMRATFTLTPSLAEQLEDYAAGRLVDRLMQLADRAWFSPDEKRYLLDMCFSINPAIIAQYPPYQAILDRRHLARLNPDYFSAQTYRDLLVWFNLAWTDPNLLERDDFLAGLVQKGRDFTPSEARGLMEKHREIMGQVLPTYRALAEKGQLELITVPFYHPILPLLVDSRIAQRPSPGLPIPDPPFRAPEDAEAQIRWAVEKHTRLMGEKPVGMWPSEGAVAPEILPLAAAAGLTWLATDEAILGESLGIYFERDETGLVRRGDLLYHPWRVATPQGDLAILFRDHDLSDRIGFVYQHLPAAQAAEDMIVRLERIARAFGNREDGLITIILDGENAWEYYEHNGDPFLHELYTRLTAHPHLTPVLPSQHLAQHPPTDTLERLASGSWILGDFTTWMGDPEHLVAWSRLRDLRDAYAAWVEETRPEPAQLHLVQHHLFAAEGSDWFWWYSHRNSSAQDALFDQLFRDYLAAAYRAMDILPPEALAQPITGMAQQPPPPRHFLTPRLTASPDPSRYWADAQVIRPDISTGAMQQAGSLVQAVRYANDADHLYLRLELSVPLARFALEMHLRTAGGAYLLRLGRDQTTAFLMRLENGSEVNVGPVRCALGEKLAEFAIPLGTLAIDLGQMTTVFLHLTLTGTAGDVVRFPHTGEVALELAQGT
ncbi:MAG TPA: glycoside hydrolase [Anaerolineae bacterium]|nr:glycoside hydrolase [Anaerolineae bacterium]